MQTFWTKCAAILAGAGAAILSLGSIYLVFCKFGILCFGGGNVLVPFYLDQFVGPEAPMLQLQEQEFGNLLAITQMTPGPISVNAATFFGFRMAGIPGALVATIGLLTPSFFLMVLALRSLDRWKENPVVKGLLWGVAPATVAIIIVAVWIFARMSVFTPEFQIRPVALLLAVFSAWALMKTRLRMTTLVFLCALLGALFL